MGSKIRKTFREKVLLRPDIRSLIRTLKMRVCTDVDEKQRKAYLALKKSIHDEATLKKIAKFGMRNCQSFADRELGPLTQSIRDHFAALVERGMQSLRKQQKITEECVLKYRVAKESKRLREGFRMRLVSKMLSHMTKRAIRRLARLEPVVRAALDSAIANGKITEDFDRIQIF